MYSALRLPVLSLLFVVVWSSGWIGSKYLLNYAGALGALAWRYMLVVLVLLILVTVFRLWRVVERREVWHQATIGLLSHTAYLSLGVAAIESGVSAGIVALITAMQPLLTLALAYPVLNERVNFLQTIGITLGLLSVFLVVGEKISLGGSLFSYSLPLFSVLSLTLASVFCRYSDRRQTSAGKPTTPLLLILLIQSSIACIGFCLLAWVFGSFTMAIEPGMVLSLVYMSVAVSIGSYFLYFALLRELCAVKVASLGYLTPPVTMIMGWVWFRESFSTVDGIGLCVAFVAVLMIARGSKAKRARKGKKAIIPAPQHRRAKQFGFKNTNRAAALTSRRVNLPSGVLLFSTVDIEL